jgi:hypothetical protein
LIKVGGIEVQLLSVEKPEPVINWLLYFGIFSCWTPFISSEHFLHTTRFRLTVSVHCEDETSAKTFDMLRYFIKKKIWVPSAAQLCMLFRNYGLNLPSDEFPTCDDVTALQSTQDRSNSAMNQSGSVTNFVYEKVMHIFRLLVSWMTTCDLELADVELLLRLTLVAASDQNWKDRAELLSLATDCVAQLLSKVDEDQRDDVVRRASEFCLSLSPKLSVLSFIVDKLCPQHAHEELRMHLAFKVLVGFYRAQNPPQFDESPMVPSARDIYCLVSKPDFPLVSANRLPKRELGQEQLLLLNHVIRLVKSSVGKPDRFSSDDKVVTKANLFNEIFMHVL